MSFRFRRHGAARRCANNAVRRGREAEHRPVLSDNKARWPETESKCQETFHGVQLELINNGEGTFLSGLQEFITKQNNGKWTALKENWK